MTIDSNTVEDIKTLFVKLYHPKAIYLFGSYVWGVPTKDSDLDFCIIVAESEKSQAERIRDGLRVLKDIHIPVDLLVLTKQEIEKRIHHPATLISKIVHNGRKIYGAA